MTSMISDMVTRADIARTSLVRSIVEEGFTEEEAFLIHELYVNHKVIRLEAGIGSYRVTHGAMFTRESLNAALEIARTEGTKATRRRTKKSNA